MKNIYVVAGRISDYENEFRLVEASSNEEAELIFEKWMREQIGVDNGDFYIEHCQTISEMQTYIIK